jgi:ribosomal protein S11
MEKKQSTIIKITFSCNNIFINLLNSEGVSFFNGTCKSFGFEGREKKTSIAAYAMGEQIVNKLSLSQLTGNIKIFTNGSLPLRKFFLRGFLKNIPADKVQNFSDRIIYDITSLPHNGCRQKKQKR